MKKPVALGTVVLVVGSLVGAVCLGEGTPSSKTPAKATPLPKLSKVRQLSAGELAAIHVTELVTAFRPVQTPMLAAYDSEEGKVGVIQGQGVP